MPELGRPVTDLALRALDPVTREPLIRFEVVEDVAEGDHTTVFEAELIVPALAAQIDDRVEPSSGSLDPGADLGCVERRGDDQADRVGVAGNLQWGVERMDGEIGMSLRERSRRVGAPAEDLDPMVGQRGEGLVHQVAGTENHYGRAVGQVPLGELAVRAPTETEQMIGPHALGVGDQSLHPGRRAAAGRALGGPHREILELPHHLGLADERGVQSADHFEEEPVGVLTQIDLVTGLEIVTGNLVDVDDGDLADTRLPHERTVVLRGEVAARLAVEDGNRICHERNLRKWRTGFCHGFVGRVDFPVFFVRSSGSMADRIGILVAQLGTPDAPTAPAVRRYLRQFLGDRRVVDLNPVLWWAILNGVILVKRPAESAALYRKVWTEEGSPLLVISEAQAKGLAERLGEIAGEVEIRAEVAMRYGNPSTGSAIGRLIEWGATRILLFPMYPQYSAATTGSTYDEVFDELKKKRAIPTLRVVPPYFDDPAYIGALAQSVRDKVASLDERPEKILISFHGIPQRYADLGDPYPRHCHATARALAREMGWREEDYLVTFQSRFGREPWLQPYTDETFIRLGREGLGRLLVICPGFTTDCLETIDEISNLGREQFEGAGGGRLERVDCLNASPRWLEAMAGIARRELSGWI